MSRARQDELAPVHPGEILLLEFLEPLGISQYRLAKDCGFSPRQVNELVKSMRAVTAPTALALGKYFGVDPQWWMNLQAHYELEMARRTTAVSRRLASIPTRAPAPA